MTDPATRPSLLVQCRPGFENEASAEIADYAVSHGLGTARADANDGYLLFHFEAARDWRSIQEALPLRALCFARQAWPVIAHLPSLPSRDRVTPIVDCLASARTAVSGVMLEYPDTNEGKTRSGFCKRFAPLLQTAMTRAGMLKPGQRRLPQLQIFFPDATQAWIGLSDPAACSQWPMGIPRLRMPRDAPSRSTLKLAEALLTLLDDTERERWLRAGQKAVDLGAAPGGWSGQLASRGLRVTAIDNGPMDPRLIADGMVTQVRADGFVWRPKGRIDWLVCDMVEQPARVAALIAGWARQGDCRHAIFNLKLPMKKRYAALQQARATIVSQLRKVPFTLRFKHLYHDREEVTGYLSRHDLR